nr:LAG1 longevity assurance homolog 3-like [Tanacetum cinerariifolium]
MGFMQGLKSIDFEYESFPTYHDFLVLPLIVTFFPIIRLFLDRLVFEGIGRWFISNNKLNIDANERKKRILKFKESAWKCVYYLSAEILTLSVTYNEPWFTKTSNFWIGPGNQRWPEQKMKLKLKVMYMYTGGFYTYSIFALIFWETRRSDFSVSMGHHIASVMLITMSYICRFARVGSVTLALHDGSDVFLEVGKIVAPYILPVLDHMEYNL